MNTATDETYDLTEMTLVVRLADHYFPVKDVEIDADTRTAYFTV